MSFSRLREPEGTIFPGRQEGGTWVQGQGRLQVTGVGSLGKGQDFPCKIHSNRPRGNLIPGRERELLGHQRGPQRGPQLQGGREER